MLSNTRFSLWLEKEVSLLLILLEPFLIKHTHTHWFFFCFLRCWKVEYDLSTSNWFGAEGSQSIISKPEKNVLSSLWTSQHYCMSIQFLLTGWCSWCWYLWTIHSKNVERWEGWSCQLTMGMGSCQVSLLWSRHKEFFHKTFWEHLLQFL